METKQEKGTTLPSAIIGLAQDRAEEEALEIMHENKELQAILRAVFVSAYVKGALGIIKDEIQDRIVEQVSGAKKAKHKKQIDGLKAKVGEPGVRKPKLKKA